MITKIKQIILLFTSYDKDEFVPIYREGKLDNLDDFILYKAAKLGNKIVDQLDIAYFSIARR